jgi:hypothetical protein
MVEVILNFVMEFQSPKLLRHPKSNHRGMGFRKQFIYWIKGMGFDM